MKQFYLTEMFGSEGVSLARISIALPLAFLLGYFICTVYRRTHRGFSYNASFNMTIIIITIIVTMIIISIESNIALSLGLVGSLSVIRFRTVLKDTIDMSFLFWAIATGLTVGTGNYVFSIVSALFIGSCIFLLSKRMFKKIHGNEYIVIVHFEAEDYVISADTVTNLFAEKQLAWEIRSSEIDKTTNHHEVVYQVNERQMKQVSSAILNDLQSIAGVKKISLLTSESNLFV